MKLELEISDKDLQNCATRIVRDAFAVDRYGSSDSIGRAVISKCVNELLDSPEFVAIIRADIRRIANDLKDAIAHDVVDAVLRKRIKKIVAEENAAGTLFEQ